MFIFFPEFRIATELVSEYPLFPQTHEMKELLDYVVDVTSGDSREYKMMSYSFRLYRVVCFTLCECRHDHKDLLQSSIQPESVSKLWDSVWKCLAAHQCHQEASYFKTHFICYSIHLMFVFCFRVFFFWLQYCTIALFRQP